MENGKIKKEIQEKNKNLFVLFFWAIFFCFLSLKLIQQIPTFLDFVFQNQEIREKIEGIKKSLKNITNPQEDISNDGLRLKIDIESGEKNLNVEILVKKNEIYFEIPLKYFFIFKKWNKVEISNEQLTEIKKLKDILEKESVFTNFSKIEGGYEFEIEKERLKNGIYQWNNNLNSTQTEKIFNGIEKIYGKILISEDKTIKHLILNAKELKINIEFENFNKFATKENDNLENFLTSIFENANIF